MLRQKKKIQENKMRNTLFVLMIACAAVFSGCSMNKDAEINSFITDMDKLTGEIVKAVDEKPSTGVDRAQQLLDARKSEMKASFEKLKDVRGFQLSEEMKKKFTDSVAKNVEAVNTLQIKYVEESIEDKNFGEKLKKLSTDYNSIFGV
jgi:hypothetical protein